MSATEIKTHSRTRFEPASFSTEFLGEAIAAAKSARPIRVVWKSEPLATIVVSETPSGSLAVERDQIGALETAWASLDDAVHRWGLPFTLTHARTRTAVRGRRDAEESEHAELASYLTDALRRLAAAEGALKPVLEQEFAFNVQPMPTRVRHVVARISRRSAAEPNPILE